MGSQREQSGKPTGSKKLIEKSGEVLLCAVVKLFIGKLSVGRHFLGKLRVGKHYLGKLRVGKNFLGKLNTFCGVLTFLNMSPKVILLLLTSIVSGWCQDVSPAAATGARQPPIYSNEFAVHVPDGPEAAAAIAEKHGFDNIGQVSTLFTG